MVLAHITYRHVTDYMCLDPSSLMYINLFFCFHILHSGMLEGLCISLYDVLRPLIIHINHLETLAELCSILKIEMLQDHVQNNRKYYVVKHLTT